MDNDFADVATSTVDDVNTVESVAGSSNVRVLEGLSSNGEMMGEIESAGMALTRVELDLACSSEKLFNLNVLMMNVATRESDFDAFASGNEDFSADSVEKALEFDLLSGILDSEVKELDSFLATLQKEIVNVQEILSSREYFAEIFKKFEDKLHDSEESLKQSQDQAAEMIFQSDMLQRTLSRLARRVHWNNGEDVDLSESGHFLDMNKINMHTAEQRRHVLRMLEKSLARELDLEKKFTELRQIEDDLKLRLHSSAQEVSYIEDEALDVWEKLLEAENTAEILMATSKELLGHLQMFQFNLNGSIQREDDLKSKLESSNQQLKAKENGMENAIKDLKDKIYVAESRAESAEDKCKLLENTNLELNEELSLLKGGASEKVDSLERQLKEYDLQLQQALAMVEAGQEKENMLYSTIRDMENVIDDLKSKVIKAESQADSAEDKCIIVSERNAELNEELSFLRSRMESVEASLHHTEETKVATVRDIGIRTKIITSLVMQLAMERERLHEQISSLAKENTVLVVKLQQKNKDSTEIMKIASKGNDRQYMSSKHEVNMATCEKGSGEDTTRFSSISSELIKTPESISADEVEAAYSTSEPVRRIDAGVLNFKHVLIAMLILIISAAIYMFQRLDVPY